MNKLIKISGVLVAIAMAGSVTMADDHGRNRDYRDYRGDRGHNSGYTHSYRGYCDGDRRYGYYRNPRGDLVFGLLGLGVAAAIVSTMDRPTTYVQQPVVYQAPPVVYVQQPPVVQQPQIIYQAAPVVQQPQVVYQAAPVVQQPPEVVQQPVQSEPTPPVTVTVNIQNSNGSFTPVTLRQVGAFWVGPRGEYYRGVPTVGQLRPLYGR